MTQNKKIMLSVFLTCLIISIIVFGWHNRESYNYVTFTCTTAHELAETQFNISMLVSIIFGILIGFQVGVIWKDKNDREAI